MTRTKRPERAEKDRQYYLKNRDRLLANSRRYREKNRERVRIYHKAWYLKNYENNKAARRSAARKIRWDIIQALGGVCVKCGFKDWRALQVDHINAGGGKDRRERKIGHTSWSLLKDVKLHKEKYQLLCANCNWIKRYENGENFQRIYDKY